MKKIFFMTSSLSGGGAEAVCVNVANGLASRGLNITIVVLNEIKSVYQNEINSNVNYKVLHVSKLRFSLFKVYFFILKEKPDKIVCFNYELSVLLLILKKIFMIKPAILSRNINNIDEKYKRKGIKGKIVRKLISVFYKKNDYVINQCFEMKKQFDSIFPSLIYKNSVIYNPLNYRFDFPFEKILDFKEDMGLYFLCIGRLNYQKSFHLALESFSSFLNKFPEYKLIIVGEGELENDLKKKVIELDIFDSVIFRGFSRDLSKLYVNAEAVLLTSKFEGFPNVLIESIAHGTPIISVDCQSGPSEIVKEGINGILLKSRSPHEISIAMVYLIKNKLNRFQVYKSSRRFSIGMILDEWEKLL